MKTPLTSYQKSHFPIIRVEVKCNGKVDSSTGRCVECGRDLAKNGKHNPNVTGSLGWVNTYADGSVAVTGPAVA